MTSFLGINTLQYMGSKSRILNEVCTPIVENKNIETVVDLFAGTGTIGYALKPHFSVISNDLEYYSYILNEGILNGCMLPITKFEEVLDSIRSQANVIKDLCQDAIMAEEQFFDRPVTEEAIREYQFFCNDTPSVISRASHNPIFNGLSSLITKVVPGQGEQMLEVPALFITYYANAYFGIKQCCEIDAIRGCIELVEDKRVQNVLLTALMSAMSNTASTTTHFAQFLKINGNNSYRNIIEKRSTSIIELFSQFIYDFNSKGLLSCKTPGVDCYNIDYLELLHSIPLDETTMVYADPPYFKEHYSRYYHILNTLCKYDYPKITNNPQTKDYSIGRYREDRNVSDFGKRKTALSAFTEMIKVCAQNKAWLTISYSSNSIVEIDDILEVMNEHYIVNTINIPLKHSKQGRASTSNVHEYLFTGKPINARKVVGQKQVFRLLETLSKTKPETDNPAGLMHNYMARKPYNIVREIIWKLCPENGVVYDPMMGSGTTLIEASKLKIRAVGTDINPLAYNIANTSLSSWDLPRIKSLIDDFVESVSDKCTSFYYFEEEGETRIIERCHFNKVEGMNELIPTSYWYKTMINGKLSARKKSDVSDAFTEQYLQYKNRIVNNLVDVSLIPNSRIAIGRNDTVYMYFCYRNLIVLDIIIGELKRRKKQYGYQVLELIVSSSINLIKLSDKKASSQMPYWIPKINVTSRNAIKILRQKKDAIYSGLMFLDSACQTKKVKKFTDLVELPGVLVAESPAQKISYSKLPKQSVDLVLTDPPYTDQVPYMEYSQLWSHILGWSNKATTKLINELVVSDAPSRNKDIGDFNTIFSSIIKRTSISVKEGGYFVMFYHSFDLKSWSSILDLMGHYGFAYQGQAPIAAPRKSFKTVMSPKSTLNGNYVVVFRKRTQHHLIFEGSIFDAEKAAIECARKIISSKKMTTSQDLYDHGMLMDAVEKGYLGLLAGKYRSFLDIISSVFEYKNGYWREK